MTQDNVRNHLLDYLDRPDEVPAALRERLVADAADRHWWQRTLTLHQALGDLGASEPPADVVTATLRAAGRLSDRMHHRQAVLSFPRWARGIALGMAAAVVLLTVGLLLVGQPPDEPPPPPPVQRVVYYDYGVPEPPAPAVQRWGELQIGEPPPDEGRQPAAVPFRIIVPGPSWSAAPEGGGARTVYYPQEPEDW